MNIANRHWILSATLALVSTHAFGWGSQGHRITAEIARRHLSPTAQKKIAELLGPDSLPRVSNWADEIRSDTSWDWVKAWHFVSIPDGSDYGHSEKSAEGDLITAIARNEATIRNKGASKTERIQALKFLIHFIGDLHQPLHVGRKEDMGGNTVKVKYFGSNSNLHVVWDSSMIDTEKLSYTEYAAFLDHASAADVAQWSKGTPEDWTKDSMDVRASLYELPPPQPPRGDAEPDTLPAISYEYQSRQIKTVEKMLLKGGIRLAARLNALFK